MGHLAQSQTGKRRWLWLWLWLALCSLLLVAGCSVLPLPTESMFVAEGNPQAGKQAIQEYGCNTCHTISGIPGPDAYAGPPLTSWPRRSYIAGNLNNTPENLIRWIRFPQKVEPGTVMPDLGVTEAAARDISAYLYEMR